MFKQLLGVLLLIAICITALGILTSILMFVHWLVMLLFPYAFAVTIGAFAFYLITEWRNS